MKPGSGTFYHVAFGVVVAAVLAGCGAAPAPAATPAPTAAPAPVTPSPAAGDMRKDAAKVAQVWVPAGSFRMGTSADAARALAAQKPPAWVLRELPSEQPEHEVRLTSGYWIDTYEVTNQAFQAFAGAGGYTQRSYWSEDGWKWLQRKPAHTTCADAAAQRSPNQPCVNVTWYEAEAYARWRGGRLPTEAEWEYAARGPQSPVYPWGDSFDPAKANLVDSSGLVPVGSYPAGASWAGAHDMAGNAMEWVQDWLDPRYYQQSVRDDPPGPTTGKVKIEKGGWWGSNPFVARAAYRHFEDPPEYADKHIGFRVVSR